MAKTTKKTESAKNSGCPKRPLGKELRTISARDELRRHGGSVACNTCQHREKAEIDLGLAHVLCPQRERGKAWVPIPPKPCHCDDHSHNKEKR